MIWGSLVWLRKAFSILVHNINFGFELCTSLKSSLSFSITYTFSNLKFILAVFDWSFYTNRDWTQVLETLNKCCTTGFYPTIHQLAVVNVIKFHVFIFVCDIFAWYTRATTSMWKSEDKLGCQSLTSTGYSVVCHIAVFDRLGPSTYASRPLPTNLSLKAQILILMLLNISVFSNVIGAFLKSI